MKNELSFFVILFLLHLSTAFGVENSSERYKDFYNRRTENQKRNQDIESSRLKLLERRSEDQKKYEKLEMEYAKTRKDQNQEAKDAFAEKWMEEQNRNHEQQLDNARQKFISNKKENNKFKIPEAEEYEVK